jgi:oligopeptide/dipeptide ABC transporter ATP-binding protein
MTTNKEQTPLITVDTLKVHFPIRKGVFGKISGSVKAVDHVSLIVNQGDVFALVGESGCGKTTTAMAIAGLQTFTGGSVKLNLNTNDSTPLEWTNLSGRERQNLRKKIQIIFQDPYSSLNPRMTVESIIKEPLLIHDFVPVKERKAYCIDLLKQVGLSEEYLTRFPHEFSGGQRQRIGIARALATNPQCVIADEPVSALDVSIQAQIINLLQELQQSHRQTQMFISHDLAVVRHIANKVAVMYLGKIVEMGTDDQVFTNPKHPYTTLLLESIPVPGKGRNNRGRLTTTDKEKSTSLKGCAFYPRCNRARSECLEISPELIDIGSRHLVSCYNPL